MEKKSKIIKQGLCKEEKGKRKVKVLFFPNNTRKPILAKWKLDSSNQTDPLNADFSPAMLNDTKVIVYFHWILIKEIWRLDSTCSHFYLNMKAKINHFQIYKNSGARSSIQASSTAKKITW